MSKQTITKTDLAQFTGTEAYHRLPYHPQGVVYTDGVKYLAERAGAYWLLDLIASYQLDGRIKNDEALQCIQFWRLKVADATGTLVCERDLNDTVLTHQLNYTDFPLAEITLYVCNKVILLPSEY